MCVDEWLLWGADIDLCIAPLATASTPSPLPHFEQLLLVTKEFQPQSGLLSATDLHALWRLVKEVPAVGFFNSGPEAGARCVVGPD